MVAKTLGAAGIALIQHFEGCGTRRKDGQLAAYPDPASGGAPWTIGWGSTGRDIVKGTVWSQAQCDARMGRDATMLAAGIIHMLGAAPVTQHQLDAMISFAYNIGLDDNGDGIAQGLGDSTLFRKHKSGDYAGAQAEFAKWNKAAGKVMPGLTRRRAAEAALYATPDSRPAPVLA